MNGGISNVFVDSPGTRLRIRVTAKTGRKFNGSKAVTITAKQNYIPPL